MWLVTKQFKCNTRMRFNRFHQEKGFKCCFYSNKQEHSWTKYGYNWLEREHHILLNLFNVFHNITQVLFVWLNSAAMDRSISIINCIIIWSTSGVYPSEHWNNYAVNLAPFFLTETLISHLLWSDDIFGSPLAPLSVCAAGLDPAMIRKVVAAHAGFQLCALTLVRGREGVGASTSPLLCIVRSTNGP